MTSPTHLTIRHTTRYTFDEPVIYGLQQLRKQPKSSHQQNVISWETDITGGKVELRFEDHHNNAVELINIDKGCQELVLVCAGKVELQETHGVVGRHLGPAPLWLYARPTARTQPGPGVRALTRKVTKEADLERLHELMGLISETVTYEIGTSDADATAEQAIAGGSGVCQDHAHIFIACARELGLPARYVSGYLMLNDRVEQDAMHAWAEAHVPDLGWVGFDVSNAISPDSRYVRVATGLDYADAAPVRGTRIGGNGETLSVELEVAQQ